MVSSVSKNIVNSTRKDYRKRKTTGMTIVKFPSETAFYKQIRQGKVNGFKDFVLKEALAAM